MRLMLITGALLALCISDSVGPRLLPLPASHIIKAAAQSQLSGGTAASPKPAPTKGSGPRMEMAAAPQFRAGSHQQQVQPATHTPQSVGELPVTIVRPAPPDYRPLMYLAEAGGVSAGRAPPRPV